MRCASQYIGNSHSSRLRYHLIQPFGGPSVLASEYVRPNPESTMKTATAWNPSWGTPAANASTPQRISPIAEAGAHSAQNFATYPWESGDGNRPSRPPRKLNA